MLRKREGNSAPPRSIRYYASGSGGSIFGGVGRGGGEAAAACEIISAGPEGTLRCFHTARDVLNTPLGTSSGGRMLLLPPTIALASCDTRSGQWADVISAHVGSSRVYCWSWANRFVGLVPSPHSRIHTHASVYSLLPTRTHPHARTGTPNMFLNHASFLFVFRRLEERALVMPDARESVSALCISACGTWGVVGGSGGW